MPHGDDADQDSFADRLNRLFAERTSKTGVELSLSQFISDFRDQTGVTLSKGYLSELRNGVAPDPRLDLVRAFSRYFNVDPSYFTVDSPARAEEIAARGTDRCATGRRCYGVGVSCGRSQRVVNAPYCPDNQQRSVIGRLAAHRLVICGVRPKDIGRGARSDSDWPLPAFASDRPDRRHVGRLWAGWPQPVGGAMVDCWHGPATR